MQHEDNFIEILNILKKCPLFASISNRDILTMLNCMSAERKHYKKGEFIFLEGSRIRHIGIVLSGMAYVVKEDYWGKRVIISQVGPGELFAEGFSCADVTDLPVSVLAGFESEILLIDYRKIITQCTSACASHSTIIGNMLAILAQKNVILTEKIQHITQRNTRDKLLSYLSERARQKRSKTFDIPFNRQELADYLSVERSAMSAELSRMAKDGLVRYNKNHFELRDDSIL